MTASRSSRFLVLGAVLVAAGAVLVAARPGRAEDPPYDMRYVSVTGDGSTAKAWFEGAPPSGTKVQDALDRFAREGYRLASLSPAWRQANVTVSPATPTSVTTPESVYVLILERGRR
jgi:hypothetical protein